MTIGENPDDEYYDWRKGEKPSVNIKNPAKDIEHELAVRIKQLGLPDWPALTPLQEQQRVYCVENMKISLYSLFFPLTLIVVAWILYLDPLRELSFFIADQPLLLKMWPPNPSLQASLAKSSFSAHDKNFFLAMTSTTSLIWALWFVWRIFREIKRKDTFYIRRWLPGFAIIAPLFVLGALALSFVANDSFRAPSLKQPISIGTIKFIFFISFAYYTSAGLIEQTLLFFRRDKTIPDFPSAPS